MPKPTDEGETYTFKIRQGVKFHDGRPLTAADVLASWRKIIVPPEGIVSPRQSNFMMVDKIEAPDPSTIVFRLKFATDAFLPALADPFAWIYSKAKLDQDIHWYEKNILGSGPFKFVEYETGQSISGVRNPDYYHQGLSYLDGFKGIFADKQATRVDAIRSDRAAVEFRGFPPTVRDELKAALGDKIAVQTSDWNCGGLITPNYNRKPFDDPRVRRALTLALDRWHTAPELSKIALVRTVGGVTFPGSPLAPTKEELQQIAGYWPDIEKSRAEAKRLLKEAGAENLSFELLNRSTDQPYKYYGNFEDEKEVKMYNELLRELDKSKQKARLLEFAKYVLDEQAHGIFLLWWQRIVPYQSYVKGWKIGPSHYVNQDLGIVWLDK